MSFAHTRWRSAMNIHSPMLSVALALTSLVLACSRIVAAGNEPMQGQAHAADGLEVSYEVRGKGDTALVFIHGWCSDRQSWQHQLGEFAGDYRIVALDLGGHGKSGRN